MLLVSPPGPLPPSTPIIAASMSSIDLGVNCLGLGTVKCSGSSHSKPTREAIEDTNATLSIPTILTTQTTSSPSSSQQHRPLTLFAKIKRQLSKNNVAESYSSPTSPNTPYNPNAYLLSMTPPADQIRHPDRVSWAPTPSFPSSSSVSAESDNLVLSRLSDDISLSSSRQSGRRQWPLSSKSASTSSLLLASNSSSPSVYSEESAYVSVHRGVSSIIGSSESFFAAMERGNNGRKGRRGSGSDADEDDDEFVQPVSLEGGRFDFPDNAGYFNGDRRNGLHRLSDVSFEVHAADFTPYLRQEDVEAHVSLEDAFANSMIRAASSSHSDVRRHVPPPLQPASPRSRMPTEQPYSPTSSASSMSPVTPSTPFFTASETSLYGDDEDVEDEDEEADDVISRISSSRKATGRKAEVFGTNLSLDMPRRKPKSEHSSRSPSTSRSPSSSSSSSSSTTGNPSVSSISPSTARGRAAAEALLQANTRANTIKDGIFLLPVEKIKIEIGRQQVQPRSQRRGSPSPSGGEWTLGLGMELPSKVMSVVGQATLAMEAAGMTEMGEKHPTSGETGNAIPVRTVAAEKSPFPCNSLTVPPMAISKLRVPTHGAVANGEASSLRQRTQSESALGASAKIRQRKGVEATPDNDWTLSLPLRTKKAPVTDIKLPQEADQVVTLCVPRLVTPGSGIESAIDGRPLVKKRSAVFASGEDGMVKARAIVDESLLKLSILSTDLTRFNDLLREGGSRPRQAKIATALGRKADNESVPGVRLKHARSSGMLDEPSRNGKILRMVNVGDLEHSRDTTLAPGKSEVALPPSLSNGQPPSEPTKSRPSSSDSNTLTIKPSLSRSSWRSVSSPTSQSSVSSISSSVKTITPSTIASTNSKARALLPFAPPPSAFAYNPHDTHKADSVKSTNVPIVGLSDTETHGADSPQIVCPGLASGSALNKTNSGYASVRSSSSKAKATAIDAVAVNASHHTPVPSNEDSEALPMHNYDATGASAEPSTPEQVHLDIPFPASISSTLPPLECSATPIMSNNSLSSLSIYITPLSSPQRPRFSRHLSTSSVASDDSFLSDSSTSLTPTTDATFAVPVPLTSLISSSTSTHSVLSSFGEGPQACEPFPASGPESRDTILAKSQEQIPTSSTLIISTSPKAVVGPSFHERIRRLQEIGMEAVVVRSASGSAKFSCTSRTSEQQSNQKEKDDSDCSDFYYSARSSFSSVH